MAYTHTPLQQVIESGIAPVAKQYSASSRVSLNETVADDQTNFQLSFALDVSAVKSFILQSDVDCLVETNDGSTPDDTISLKAGVPYVWNTDSYNAFLFTEDITALFVTTADGAANIQCEALIDVTP